MLRAGAPLTEEQLPQALSLASACPAPPPHFGVLRAKRSTLRLSSIILGTSLCPCHVQAVAAGKDALATAQILWDRVPSHGLRFEDEAQLATLPPAMAAGEAGRLSRTALASMLLSAAGASSNPQPQQSTAMCSKSHRTLAAIGSPSSGMQPSSRLLTPCALAAGMGAPSLDLVAWLLEQGAAPDGLGVREENGLYKSPTPLSTVAFGLQTKVTYARMYGFGVLSPQDEAAARGPVVAAGLALVAAGADVNAVTVTNPCGNPLRQSPVVGAIGAGATALLPAFAAAGLSAEEASVGLIALGGSFFAASEEEIAAVVAQARARSGGEGRSARHRQNVVPPWSGSHDRLRPALHSWWRLAAR